MSEKFIEYVGKMNQRIALEFSLTLAKGYTTYETNLKEMIDCLKENIKKLDDEIAILKPQLELEE